MASDFVSGQVAQGCPNGGGTQASGVHLLKAGMVTEPLDEMFFCVLWLIGSLTVSPKGLPKAETKVVAHQVAGIKCPTQIPASRTCSARVHLCA